MDKDEHDALAAELAALGSDRTAAEASSKALSKRSLAALVDALRRGMGPAEVARNLCYTDGYVRKVGRKNGIKPDPRYADLTPPTRRKAAQAETATPVEPQAARPEPAPAPQPVSRVARLAREGELLAYANELTPEREAELVELMHQRNSAWLAMVRQPGMTDKELIRRGIKDGKLTASDLRN
jgi:hypothetical protein